jgi:prepilin-type N-terminal cleavage/methylation domain-containing protein
MKTEISRTRRFQAFTLIELLTVIAVIAILAALLFPAAAAFKKSAAIKKARTELLQVALAIESYKGNLNHYPPDNPGNPAVNQLYFELLGTTNFDSGIYLTDAGQGMTNPAGFFGPQVTGFVNISRGGDDEAQHSKNCLPGLKPSQYLEITNGSGGTATLLGTSTKGPFMLFDSNQNSINPLRYVSTGPTNNPASYDLWVDVILGGKTYRISNWSERADVAFDP